MCIFSHSWFFFFFWPNIQNFRINIICLCSLSWHDILQRKKKQIELNLSITFSFINTLFSLLNCVSYCNIDDIYFPYSSMISIMLHWTPVIRPNKPNAMMNTFFHSRQYPEPRPGSFQQVIVSTKLGKTSPKNERHNAPTSVIIGPKLGTNMATTTVKIEMHKLDTIRII